MNKIILCTLWLATTMLNGSCKAQHKQAKKNTTMSTDIINKNFEKFDTLLYNRLAQKSNTIDETTMNGTYRQMLKANSGDVFRETEANTYFTVVKLFYKNGNIQSKGLMFNTISLGSFKQGIWYEFNEKGDLVNEIDYNKDYNFTFEKLIAFCKNENIPLILGPIKNGTGMHTHIRKINIDNTKQAAWEINWLKQPDSIEQIILDGNTGTLISKTSNPYINN
jgi:hypothetical protein